jgi:hypothetical protein
MDKDTKLNSAIWTMMQSLRDHLGHNCSTTQQQSQAPERGLFFCLKNA